MLTGPNAASKITIVECSRSGARRRQSWRNDTANLGKEINGRKPGGTNNARQGNRHGGGNNNTTCMARRAGHIIAGCLAIDGFIGCVVR